MVFFASLAGVGAKALGAPPNVELLMPFVVAAGLARGPGYGFAAGFAIRGAYDVYLGWAGPWTIMTTLAYGLTGALIGLVGHYWRVRTRGEITLAAGCAALFYDVVTMLVGWALFPMPFVVLVVGQVPFSVNHAASSMLFCFVLVPSIVRVLRSFTEKSRNAVSVAAPTYLQQKSK